MRPVLRVLNISLLIIVAVSVRAGVLKHQTEAAPLEKTEWKLIWLGSTKIELGVPQQVPYIQLDPENHRVSGSGGCNRLSGTYELEGNHLKFTQMAMSRMACLHGGETENAFTQALDLVTAWKIVGGTLLLMDADQQVVAKFSAVAPES